MEIRMIHLKENEPQLCLCGHPMKEKYEDYQYTESGLKDVTLLHALKHVCLKCGEEDITIKNMDALHLTIASEIIKRNPLSPEEFFFLKSFLNFDDEKTFRLGLDFHGVIDANPKVFSNLSFLLKSAGHEVHIITGRRIVRDFEDKLENLDIHYTHLFSISDYHFKYKTAMTGYYDDNPKIDPETWNRTKAKYCDWHKIHLHIDDSDVYGNYFKTPYLTYYKDDEKTLLRYLKKKGIRDGLWKN